MYNDEIIADSEDEDELFGPYRAVPAVDSTTTITTISADSTSKSAAEASTISEFTTSKATASDTISNLSLVAPNALANPSITSVTTTTANTSRPRPKPKPIVKKPNISTTGDSPGKASSSTSNIEMFDMTLSIADRAKMRKRGNDNRDSSSSSGPGFRPDIIELSSSEDELALPAPKKLKKTVKKTTEKFTSSTRNVIRLDSPKSDLISSSFSLPTVTSPVLPRNGNRNRASSILPPSDPPQSTPSDIFDLPAIEILPNPSSSASASASYVSRAHRPHVDMSTDLDALPPPLPFFADPSSSPFMMDKNSNTNLDAGNPHTVEGASKILHSVLMPPPPIPPSPGLPPTAQPRAKKPGTKRKKMSDEDEFMLDTEDWADTEPKGKGKKARSKRKEKAQVWNLISTLSQLIVDGLLCHRTKGRRRKRRVSRLRKLKERGKRRKLHLKTRSKVANYLKERMMMTETSTSCLWLP
ncbi:hypothetical protein J3R30DRAFT_219290 [Lentinula aciculospora]|uniref:Uncharacterized protein n=1 Tax=Lentinula aciculospora TaxID=153920 RepID=A0A9W9DM84_9AGAR|nr:hypothetical protein J3R30DRAFT_219290 [Lentinula aciculospora]